MIAGRYLHGLASFSILATLAAAGTSAETPLPVVPAKAGSPAADSPPSFAIVELFTSEFCGACPAADRLLSEIGAQARKRGQRILPLAFHVDYFNRGGMVDPYSDAAFTRRQRNYAAVLDGGDLYTPQMVVNGRSPFVGNERGTAQQQIKAALERPAAASVRVELDGYSRTSETVRVNCEVQGAAATAGNLQIAVTERGLLGGHDNVVRVFKTVPLSKGSSQLVEVRLPRNLDRRNASVVAFVQDSRTLAISGAAGIDLEPPMAVQRVARADE